MKIAYFILNNFEYDTRARLEVETLLDAGFSVDIIATAGAKADNFKGAKIHRLPQWPGPTRKFRFLQYNFLAARVGARLKADYYHAVDLDVLWAAYQASGKGKKPVIYEARELYTELEPLAGRNTIKAVWRTLERKLIHKPARIVTINESIAKELCNRYDIAPPVVIRNVAVLPKEIHPVDLRAQFGIPSDWKVLIYQGVLRSGQGLPYLVDIMTHLEKTALIFVGDGAIKPELEQKVSRLSLHGRIKFAGRVSPEQLQNYTAGADAGILLMEDVALNNRLALPQKLFQYMVAGIPQIVSPMPEISGFVKAEQTGIVVPLDDSRKAACEISDFLSDRAKLDGVRDNCAKSALRNNWQIESKKLVKVYEELSSK